MTSGQIRMWPVKVSAIVMTYNHAKFIAQALDSVLMQKTKFPFELLITEDCSTDGTREIVIEYQKRFPDKIRLLLSERNLRSNAVVSRAVRASRGEFIAPLDGDDYWTCDGKLQKQVDFLEGHPDYTVCFHNAVVVSADGRNQLRNWNRPDQEATMTLERIWRGNPIAFGSTMFRNGVFGDLPGWFDELFPITDWPIHILNAEHGKIGYLDEVMGAYRHHEGGQYTTRTEFEKFEKTLQFYRAMNRNLNYRYNAVVKNAIFKYFLEWAEEYEKRGERDKVRFCVRKCFAGRPLKKKQDCKRLLRVIKHLYWGPKSVRAVALADSRS